MSLPSRPRHRGLWITVAVISALFVLAPLGSEAYGQFARQTRSTHVTETSERHRIGSVDVEAGSAEVSVGPGADGGIRIQQRLSWALSRPPKVERWWVGDRLKIRTACDGTFAMTSMGCQISLDLQVPDGTPVHVVSASGTVRASGLTGPLDIRTDSGTVKLYAVHGPVTAHAGSGSVTGTALFSHEVHARADSGTVELDFGAAPRRVTGTVNSGSLTVTVPPGSRYRVRGHAGSGRVHIDDQLQQPTSDRSVEVSADSGSVSVGYPGW
ncbi:DUF4097 family beta strand repeat-containing protein [Streptomyces avermitilis]|uniref:DUF4097 family beta strand repeat-containing protein n=1 Tax=Streptomyces avermitilis TaxID=33903 RepID=UPI0033A8E6D3